MIEFRTKRTDPGSPLPNSDAYDEIYRTTPIQQIDSFYSWALRTCGVRRGDRFLDISCGVGRLTDLAARAGARAVGIDVASAAIMSGHAAGVRAPLVVGDAEELPFADQSFDWVVNLGSLEHYAHPERGVAEMARVLRADGQALILLPNTFGFLHVLYVWQRGMTFDDGQPIQRYGTRQDWQDLLERHGLTVQRTIKFQRPLPQTWSDALWYVRRPTKFLQILVSAIMPLDAAGFLVFLCHRSSPGAG